MGSNTAIDLAENVIDIRQSIAIQLRANHYPPVPLTMVEPCVEAIYACIEEDYEKEIALPNGVTYKGNTTASAQTIVEDFHLQPWL